MKNSFNINILRSTLVVLLFFVSLGNISAQTILSKRAQISLLTCSPGTDIYNTFGHSAVRVYDSSQNMDIVFNYGTFSFGGKDLKDQLNFGVEFARGKLLYYLSVSDYPNFKYSYELDKRSIYEQVLNLTHEEKQTLFDLLVINYQPENRFYQYDFFYDNCSSRIRDIVEKAIGYDLQFAINPDDAFAKSGRTFMDMIDPYINESPWLKFGIYILLGLPANKDASIYHQMFLPDYLMSGFENAVVTRDGEEKPLVLVTRTLYEAPEREKAGFSLFTPFWLLLPLAILIVIISYRNIHFDKQWFVIDYIVFGLSGLLGILLLLMWFATDHSTTKVNLNLLWALPTNFIALFFLKKKWMQKYALAALILLVIIVVNWMWFPQKMHVAFLPVIAILASRYIKLMNWHKYVNKSN